MGEAKQKRGTDSEPVGRDERCAFMAGKLPDGRPMMIIGIPRAAYERMADGKTSHFDLGLDPATGSNLTIMLFGAGSYDEAMKTLEQAAAREGRTLDIKTGKDFGVR